MAVLLARGEQQFSELAFLVFFFFFLFSFSLGRLGKVAGTTSTLNHERELNVCCCKAIQPLEILICFVVKAERQRQRAPVFWFTPQSPTAAGGDCAGMKLGAWDSV